MVGGLNLETAFAEAIEAYESFLSMADMVFDAEFDHERAVSFRHTASNVGVSLLMVARKATEDASELAELLRELGESLVLLAAAPNVETLPHFPFVDPAAVRQRALAIGVSA